MAEKEQANNVEPPDSEQTRCSSRCYTPGPWRVDETAALGAYGVWADYDHNPSGQSQVCSVFTNNKCDFPREMRDANAMLIAKAPELAETLKQLFEMTNPLMAHDDSTLHRVRQRAEKLIAAIGV